MAVAFGRVWKHAVVLLALLILLSTLEHGWLAGGHPHVVLSVLIGLPLLVAELAAADRHFLGMVDVVFAVVAAAGKAVAESGEDMDLTAVGNGHK